MDKMRMETADLTARNVEKIAALFPNCVTEALDEERSTKECKVYKKVVNFELLRQMLSDEVVEGDEAYEFTWVGKKAAVVEAHKPIRKTLRPCPKESVNWDTTSISPPTSRSERLSLPSPSSNTRRPAIFSASHLASASVSVCVTPSSTQKPAPIAPVLTPSESTEAELTLCTTALMNPAP